MAWGYEASFTIEHDNTLKRKICCKDCIYYEKTDKSCLKRPLYLPEDGFGAWRTCKYFDLNPDADHYGEKKNQYMATYRRMPDVEKIPKVEKKPVLVQKMIRRKS